MVEYYLLTENYVSLVFQIILNFSYVPLTDLISLLSNAYVLMLDYHHF